ncbi:PAC2 family protein [Dehalogenimonas sp. THU2]|uniref:PAC2 family protein n=1 Tax=Dehalogenimonas sp. THU2 TaxID=3151121 RepID=UPI003218A78D
MGYRLEKEPELHNPDLIVGWPGIGNVGLLAVETLWRQLEAEHLGDIEPEPFFYPSGLVIKDGILENLSFPASRFYYKQLPHRDLIFFTGEEQPSETGSTYAAGAKAYEMANHVLDVAEHFGCRRIFTSGAAVSAIHHDGTPGVWTVATNASLLAEINASRGNRLSSELQGRGAQANVSGLNGLLVGVASRRGLPAACLMGEVPDYLARSPMPYPAAVKSVLEVISGFLDLKIDYAEIETMRRQMSEMIDQFFNQFPDHIKEKLSQRRQVVEAEGGEAITDEDKQWMEEHIEDLFRPGTGGDDRAA